MNQQEINKRILAMGAGIEGIDAAAGLTILSMFILAYTEYLDMDIDTFISGLRESHRISNTNHNNKELH